MRNISRILTHLGKRKLRDYRISNTLMKKDIEIAKSYGCLIIDSFDVLTLTEKGHSFLERAEKLRSLAKQVYNVSSAGYQIIIDNMDDIILDNFHLSPEAFGHLSTAFVWDAIEPGRDFWTSVNIGLAEGENDMRISNYSNVAEGAEITLPPLERHTFHPIFSGSFTEISAEDRKKLLERLKESSELPAPTMEDIRRDCFPRDYTWYTRSEPLPETPDETLERGRRLLSGIMRRIRGE